MFFIFLNFFQTWQLNHGILATSRMTGAYYFKTFLATGINSEDRKLLSVLRPYDGIETMPDVSQFNHTHIAKFTYDDAHDAGCTERTEGAFHYSGNCALRLDRGRIYSPAFKRSFTALTGKDYAWIRVTAYIYPSVDLKKNPASLVITFQHKEGNYKYFALALEKQNLRVGQWNKISAAYMTPEVRDQNDEVSIYFWLRGNKPIYIDDLSIDLYEPKEAE